MADEALSQTDLARVFGVSRASVSHYLSGRTEPSIGQISDVAKYIGVSLDYLIYGKPTERVDVPLLSWEMIEPYVKHGVLDGARGDVNYLRCTVRSCSERTFAVRVQGDSMDSDGGYRHGEVIFVDPDKSPVHGHDVVVKVGEQRLVLRRLSIHEDGQRYFRALNRHLPVNVTGPDPGAEIYGVVVFSGRFRG